ncbi:MAG: DegQ family serine endoprotease [Kiritimatiellia bacterium]
MRRKLLFGTGAVCVVLFISVFAAGAAVPANESIETLKKTSSAFTRIARKAIPAVVFIDVEKTIELGGGRLFRQNDPFGDFFGDDFFERFFPEFRNQPRRRAPGRRPREYKQRGQGSGFIISRDGYILTNHHVVGDADKITVTLHDGRQFEAERIGSDEKSEVAVIKIDAEDLPCLEIGDSSALEVGDWVVAVGNPFGLTETVTAGIVSAKGRAGMRIADYENFIQTDAAINPGNSGGPLIDIHGKVVGINTAIMSRSGGYMGIGFAIPINMAVPIKDQLVKTGKVTRGYLGIYIQELTPELAESFGIDETDGVLIGGVMEDSPAEKARLKEGDIILELNGKKTGGVAQFRNNIASTPPGEVIKLTVFREDGKKKIEATIGTLPEEGTAASSSPEMAEQLGLEVAELEPETAEKYGYEIGSGVLVTQVKQDSASWSAGIRPGSLITDVNRVPVSTADEFIKAVSKSEKSRTVLLRVTDGEASRYIVLKF